MKYVVIVDYGTEDQEFVDDTSYGWTPEYPDAGQFSLSEARRIADNIEGVVVKNYGTYDEEIVHGADNFADQEDDPKFE